ncbi:MAG: thiol oxidoreductase [Acidimicrobiales bacterium]|nr:thiol oxidoreductase [Acidimicrobiales bacterium]
MSNSADAHGSSSFTVARGRDRRDRAVVLFVLAVAIVLAAACGGAKPSDSANQSRSVLLEIRLGGRGTTMRSGPDAFSFSARNLAIYESTTFAAGKPFFNEEFVPTGTPSTPVSRSGLGPFFAARSCLGCHTGHGAGAGPDQPGRLPPGMVVRLTLPRPDGTNSADPVYGQQLQDLALPGVSPEGYVEVTFEETEVVLADGEQVVLQSPRYTVKGLAYGPLAEGTVVSVRVAPPVIGLGLLEAITEADLAARADPDDLNGDGISGRLNEVDDIGRGRRTVGRFGWKAGQPSVEQQTAAALHNDLGVTSPLFPSPDCTAAELACSEWEPVAGGPTPGSVGADGEPITEVDRKAMYELTFYTRTLAVPARRDSDDPEVRRGAEVFDRIGCAACHTPSFVTGQVTLSALAGQVIYPYSDLLLHDMGDGLADGFPEGEASGREWRTPPLWGIGLRRTVSGTETYLHDGRARTLSEAILWHGGEGQAARDRFVQLSTGDRNALLRFLAAL